MSDENHAKKVDIADIAMAFGPKSGRNGGDRAYSNAEARSLKLLEEFGPSGDMPDPKIGSLDALRLIDELENAPPPKVADVFHYERRATHRLLSWWKSLRDSEEGRSAEPGKMPMHLNTIDQQLRAVSIIGKTSHSKKSRRSYYLGRFYNESLSSDTEDKYDAAFLLGMSYYLAEFLDRQTDFSYHVGKTNDANGRTMYFRAIAAPLYRSFDDGLAWIFTGAVSSRDRESAEPAS